MKSFKNQTFIFGTQSWMDPSMIVDIVEKPFNKSTKWVYMKLILKCQSNYVTKEPLIECNDQMDLQIFAIVYNFFLKQQMLKHKCFCKSINSFVPNGINYKNLLKITWTLKWWSPLKCSTRKYYSIQKCKL